MPPQAQTGAAVVLHHLLALAHGGQGNRRTDDLRLRIRPRSAAANRGSASSASPRTSHNARRRSKPVLSKQLHRQAMARRYGACTFEKEFSRRDDACHAEGRAWLGGERPKGKRDGQAADQMRMGAELVAPGTALYYEVHATNLTAAELGCLALALSDFAVSPFIGGQNSRGHGLVDLDYDIVAPVRDDAFAVMADSEFLPSDTAEAAIGIYLTHLEASQDLLREVLKCAA